jgi:hypothetical protein
LRAVRLLNGVKKVFKVPNGFSTTGTPTRKKNGRSGKMAKVLLTMTSKKSGKTLVVMTSGIIRVVGLFCFAAKGKRLTHLFHVAQVSAQ